jgi:hypothetical protein
MARFARRSLSLRLMAELDEVDKHLLLFCPKDIFTSEVFSLMKCKIGELFKI